MKNKAIFMTMLFFLAGMGIAGAEGFSITGRAGYFAPFESIFRDLYGNGMSWGGELDYRLTNRISIWGGADYFSRSGKLLFTQEETRIRIVPLMGGVKYEFLSGRLRPYLGAGVGYFRCKETNGIGTVEKGNVGFCGRIGLIIKLGASFFADIQGDFTRCSIKSNDLTAQIGGIQAVMGLGVEF